MNWKSSNKSAAIPNASAYGFSEQATRYYAQLENALREMQSRQRQTQALLEQVNKKLLALESRLTDVENAA